MKITNLSDDKKGNQRIEIEIDGCLFVLSEVPSGRLMIEKYPQDAPLKTTTFNNTALFT